MKRTIVCSLTAALLGLFTLTLHAGTNGFVVPSFRGSANSQAGYWETFSVAVSGAGNGPDKAGATTSARLTQTNTNAFLTGSGNIYNLDGASQFILTNTTPYALGTVVLQTRTLGTELDYASALLHYTDGLDEYDLKPLARYEVNRGVQPGLGATVSSLWLWDLSGLGVSNYSLSFRAAGASTSFDSMTLDTSAQFVPVWPLPFVLSSVMPSIERWMYPNNGAPCDRPAGSTFGTFGDDSGVDTRFGQHLIGWDTTALVPTNRGSARYLVRRCRITLTINRGNLFSYDPTQDDFRSYFPTNDPAYLPDTDTGRPMELFGAGFRNGFSATNFDQCAAFGSSAAGQRNAFVAGWSTNGTLVDVGNNVGKTNAAFPSFEVAPFAIGQTTNAAPGALVPAGAKITFDLNLADPFVLAYVQDGLNSGRLRFMLSSLHVSSGQFGGPAYPDFVTHFNDAVVDPTRLDLEGVAVRDTDSDSDGLRDDWEQFHFASLSNHATNDLDGDGLNNLAELRAGTNPTNAASALRLAPATRPAAGHPTLSFPHAASHQYTVEWTENFQSWRSATNAPLYRLGVGVADWTEPQPPTAQRFYRVRGE